MTNVDSHTCTALTVLIEGGRHTEAADAFMIQFADGGLDEEFEARLNNKGYSVSDTEFDLKSRTMTLKLGK